MEVSNDQEAGQALEEIGQLQRQIEAGQADPESAGNAILERAEAVLRLYSTSSTAYEALVEPLQGWAVFALAPVWLKNPDTVDGARHRALFDRVSAFAKRYEYMKP